MKSLRDRARSIPFIRRIVKLYNEASSPASQRYWEARYRKHGKSGAGSYGKFAEFKASVLNAFVQEHDIRSVIEFGCGDGNQLSLASYPTYIGLDVSSTIIKACEERFRADDTKSFFLYDPHSFEDRHPAFKADLALSLDVIYHLLEDDIFELHMRHLFSSAERYVVIYSSDTDEDITGQVRHIRHRHFSKWVNTHSAEWRLLRTIPNKYPYQGDHHTGSFADFFMYEKI